MADTKSMNEFEWLQWFLEADFLGVLQRVDNNVNTALINQTKVIERIDKMEANLKAQFDALTASIAADSEQKAKVLAEIKDTVKKLADAQAGGQAAIDAAVKTAVEAQATEVASALVAVQDAQNASVEATKALDAQIADLEPAPAPAV